MNRADKVDRLVTEDSDKNAFLAKRSLPFLESEQTLQKYLADTEKTRRKK